MPIGSTATMAGRHQVHIDTDVVYGQGAGTDGTTRDLRCDVYRPEGPEGPKPAVLLIHGGGWRRGDRTQLKGYGVLIGREGYVCVAPEYRLVPEAPWPAQMDDVRTALGWVVDHAEELEIDPSRIAVEGNSAGAHLALLLAADKDLPIRACIAVYAPTLLSHGEREKGAVPLVALADDGGSPEIAHEASPIRHVTPSFPPTQLIHGTDDELVPVAASFAMYEELRSHGVPVDLHVHGGQPHAFDAIPELGRLCAQEMLVFLDRHLSDAAAADG